MQILNFGSINLDYVYHVKHFAMPGETLAVESQTVNAGGKGLNQSIALARAGARVSHGGCIGVGGETLESLLQENGVDTTHLRKTHCLQGNAVIQVNSAGENCILLYGGSNQAVTRQQIAQTLSDFHAGDYLVLQNEISCLNFLVELGAEKGMQIVLNPSPFDDSLRTLDYSKISWLLLNEVEAMQLCAKEEPEAVWQTLHEKYPKLNVVLTLGGAGAVCFTPEKTVRQPVFPTQAVDTTGAGDTFSGYFLAGLIFGLSLEECMCRAAMASSIAVSRHGASCAIPKAEEVDKCLQAIGHSNEIRNK